MSTVQTDTDIDIDIENKRWKFLFNGHIIAVVGYENGELKIGMNPTEMNIAAAVWLRIMNYDFEQ